MKDWGALMSVDSGQSGLDGNACLAWTLCVIAYYYSE